MGKMLTAPGSNAVAFIDTQEERKTLKPMFPVIPNAPVYPSRGIMARIIYQDDGTIRAEYLPGVANYSSWMARKIPWARWKQIGEGIWLGATVTAEEAEYVIKLTESSWSEGGEYEIIGKREDISEVSVIGDKTSKVLQNTAKPIAAKPRKSVGTAAKSVDGGEEYGQLSLFG